MKKLGFALVLATPLLAKPVAGSSSKAQAVFPAEEERDAKDDSHWKREWPEFSWLEGALTLAAGGATAGLLLAGPTAEPRWSGGVLFDGAVRRSLRVSDDDARVTYQRVGDYSYYAAPVLALTDALLVPLIARGDTRAARNMTFITIEAFSYTGLATITTTSSVARERPDSSHCSGAECAADTQSFFSGHSAIAATTAGLVCAHHVYMPIGSPAADIAACALASTNALVTGTTRVVADRHYATDVLTGLGVGFAIGYAVPWLLHFKHSAPKLDVSVNATAGDLLVRVGWRQ